ncbi:hypothetical protein BDA96_01G425200 [Sorghum bicolor]|uniref:Uncharacterized protein n=2 Tax=Sorghum bicolor TaxID=4558 RepID=A0A921V330_SORBI|nr:hypothetical protein BDA96_01G425200 [Sorghum bicolor]OQU92736.1 hypothetical protein SORBI_3001G399501 [Sorghum bicolor]
MKRKWKKHYHFIFHRLSNIKDEARELIMISMQCNGRILLFCPLCSVPLCASFRPPLRPSTSPGEKLSFVPIFQPPKAYPSRASIHPSTASPSMATATGPLLPGSFSNPATHHRGTPPDTPRGCPIHPQPHCPTRPHPSTPSRTGTAMAMPIRTQLASSAPPPPACRFAAFRPDKIPRPFCRRILSFRCARGRVAPLYGLLPAGSVSVTRPTPPPLEEASTLLPLLSCAPRYL